MSKDALWYKLEICYDPRGYYGEIPEMAINCSDDVSEKAPGFSYICINHKEIKLTKAPRNGHCESQAPLIPKEAEEKIREKYEKLEMMHDADKKELLKESEIQFRLELRKAMQKECHETAIKHRELREQERAKENGKTIKISLEHYHLFLQAALENFRAECSKKEALTIFYLYENV